LERKFLDADVLELARGRLVETFDRFDHVAVAFSGGKDSTVALHLTLEEAQRRGRLPLDVFFWDEEAIHPPTIEYVDRVRQNPDVALRWLCVPHVHRNACSRKQPYWYPWAAEAEDLWCRPLPEHGLRTLPGYDGLVPEKRKTIPDAITHVFPDTSATVGVVTGIRAQESLRRLRIVTKRQTDNWISSVDGGRHIHLLKPIYDWRTEDVWTAPMRFGWDYNHTYDVYNKIGTPKHNQRVCPPFGEEPLGSLWQYAQCFPDLWEKMLRRVPGAAAAGRYSQSPLYGFGASDPGAGESWQAAITKVLARWPEDLRTQIATRIKAMIETHNRSTGNAPIPDKPAGGKGLSWQLLYKIAFRGDLKGRKVPNLDPSHKYRESGSRKLSTRWEGS